MFPSPTNTDESLKIDSQEANTVDNVPVLSIPENPNFSGQTSALKLFSQITGQVERVDRSPVLKTLMSNAAVLSDKSVRLTTSHVRCLDFNAETDGKTIEEQPAAKKSKTKTNNSKSTVSRRESPRLQKLKANNIAAEDSKLVDSSNVQEQQKMLVQTAPSSTCPLINQTKNSLDGFLYTKTLVDVLSCPNDMPVIDLENDKTKSNSANISVSSKSQILLVKNTLSENQIEEIPVINLNDSDDAGSEAERNVIVLSSSPIVNVPDASKIDTENSKLEEQKSNDENGNCNVLNSSPMVLVSVSPKLNTEQPKLQEQKSNTECSVFHSSPIVNVPDLPKVNTDQQNLYEQKSNNENRNCSVLPSSPMVNVPDASEVNIDPPRLEQKPNNENRNCSVLPSSPMVNVSDTPKVITLQSELQEQKLNNENTNKMFSKHVNPNSPLIVNLKEAPKEFSKTLLSASNNNALGTSPISVSPDAGRKYLSKSINNVPDFANVLYSKQRSSIKTPVYNNSDGRKLELLLFGSDSEFTPEKSIMSSPYVTYCSNTPVVKTNAKIEVSRPIIHESNSKNISPYRNISEKSSEIHNDVEPAAVTPIRLHSNKAYASGTKEIRTPNKKYVARTPERKSLEDVISFCKEKEKAKGLGLKSSTPLSNTEISSDFRPVHSSQVQKESSLQKSSEVLPQYSSQPSNQKENCIAQDNVANSALIPSNFSSNSKRELKLSTVKDIHFQIDTSSNTLSNTTTSKDVAGVRQPPKKRIRPIPVDSPSTETFNAFSPFGTSPSSGKVAPAFENPFQKELPESIPSDTLKPVTDIQTKRKSNEITSTSFSDHKANSTSNDIFVAEDHLSSSTIPPHFDSLTPVKQIGRVVKMKSPSVERRPPYRIFTQPSIWRSGKPRAMAAFYEKAFPNKVGELPISPISFSNSSCTVDAFSAKRKLLDVSTASKSSSELPEDDSLNGSQTENVLVKGVTNNKNDNSEQKTVEEKIGWKIIPIEIPERPVAQSNTFQPVEKTLPVEEETLSVDEDEIILCVEENETLSMLDETETQQMEEDIKILSVVDETETQSIEGNAETQPIEETEENSLDEVFDVNKKHQLNIGRKRKRRDSCYSDSCSTVVDMDRDLMTPVKCDDWLNNDIFRESPASPSSKRLCIYTSETDDSSPEKESFRNPKLSQSFSIIKPDENDSTEESVQMQCTDVTLKSAVAHSSKAVLCETVSKTPVDITQKPSVSDISHSYPNKVTETNPSQEISKAISKSPITITSPKRDVIDIKTSQPKTETQYKSTSKTPPKQNFKNRQQKRLSPHKTSKTVSKTPVYVVPPKLNSVDVKDNQLEGPTKNTSSRKAHKTVSKTSVNVTSLKQNPKRQAESTSPHNTSKTVSNTPVKLRSSKQGVLDIKSSQPKKLIGDTSKHKTVSKKPVNNISPKQNASAIKSSQPKRLTNNISPYERERRSRPSLKIASLKSPRKMPDDKKHSHASLENTLTYKTESPTPTSKVRDTSAKSIKRDLAITNKIKRLDESLVTDNSEKNNSKSDTLNAQTVLKETKNPSNQNGKRTALLPTKEPLESIDLCETTTRDIVESDIGRSNEEGSELAIAIASCERELLNIQSDHKPQSPLQTNIIQMDLTGNENCKSEKQQESSVLVSIFFFSFMLFMCIFLQLDNYLFSVLKLNFKSYGPPPFKKSPSQSLYTAMKIVLFKTI